MSNKNPPIITNNKTTITNSNLVTNTTYAIGINNIGSGSFSAYDSRNVSSALDVLERLMVVSPQTAIEKLNKWTNSFNPTIIRRLNGESPSEKDISILEYALASPGQFQIRTFLVKEYIMLIERASEDELKAMIAFFLTEQQKLGLSIISLSPHFQSNTIQDLIDLLKLNNLLSNEDHFDIIMNELP